jgi:hypothetical protein
MTAYIDPAVSHTTNAVFSVTFALIPGTTVYEIDTITIVNGGAYWSGFSTLPITLVPASYGDVIFASGSWTANLTAGVVTSITAPGYKGMYRGADTAAFATVDHTVVGAARWTGLTGVVVDRMRSAPTVTATVGGETLTLTMEYVADGEQSYWRVNTISSPTSSFSDGTPITFSTSADTIEELNAIAVMASGAVTISRRGRYYRQTYTETETTLPPLACKSFPDGWTERLATFLGQTFGISGAGVVRGGPTQGETATTTQVVDGYSMSFSVTRVSGSATVDVSIV